MFSDMPEIGSTLFGRVLCRKFHVFCYYFFFQYSIGFDEFYGLLGGGFNHFTKQQGVGRYDFWNGFEPEWDNKTHSTDLLSAKAINLVNSHSEDPSSDPYFLYLAYPAVHDPLQAPERHQKLCSHIRNARRRLRYILS